MAALIPAKVAAAVAPAAATVAAASINPTVLSVSCEIKSMKAAITSLRQYDELKDSLVASHLCKLDVILSEMNALEKPIIGLYGPTKCGKSSLCNALIGSEILPTSFAAVSCTPCLIQVEHGAQYRVRVDRPTPQEWAIKRLQLVNQMKDEKGCSESKFILTGMYGVTDLRTIGTDEKWESAVVRAALVDTDWCAPLTNVAAVRERLRVLIRPDEQKGELALWPIISKVYIEGPFALPEGIQLVDMPGVGDRNSTFVDRTNQYRKKCTRLLFTQKANEGLGSAIQPDLLWSELVNSNEFDRCSIVLTQADTREVMTDDADGNPVRTALLPVGESAASVERDVRKHLLLPALTASFHDTATDVAALVAQVPIVWTSRSKAAQLRGRPATFADHDGWTLPMCGFDGVCDGRIGLNDQLRALSIEYINKIKQYRAAAIDILFDIRRRVTQEAEIKSAHLKDSDVALVRSALQVKLDGVLTNIQRSYQDEKAAFESSVRVMGDAASVLAARFIDSCCFEVHRVCDPLWHSTLAKAISESAVGSYWISAGQKTTRHLVNGNCNMFPGFRDALVALVRATWINLFDATLQTPAARFRKAITDQQRGFIAAISEMKELKEACARVGCAVPEQKEASGISLLFAARFDAALQRGRAPGSLERLVLQAVTNSLSGCFRGASDSSDICDNMRRDRAAIIGSIQRSFSVYFATLVDTFVQEMRACIPFVRSAHLMPLVNDIELFLKSYVAATPSVDTAARDRLVAKLAQLDMGTSSALLAELFTKWQVPPPVAEEQVPCIICISQLPHVWLTGCRCTQSSVSMRYCLECARDLHQRRVLCPMCRSAFTGYHDTMVVE